MRDRRQLRAMQDLVRVRVADAAEDARVGQRALQRVVLGAQARGERRDVGAERLRGRPCRTARAPRAADQVQRRAPLGARFGQRERAVSKSSSASVMRPGGFCVARQPAEASGDHQVDDEEEVAVERDDDALAEAADVDDARDSRAPPSGGSTVRSTNGLTMRTRTSGWPATRASQRIAVDDRRREAQASGDAGVTGGSSCCAESRQAISLSWNRLPPPLGGDAHAQRVELDEAGGVLLVVGAGVVVERRDRRVEQRIVRRRAADAR